MGALDIYYHVSCGTIRSTESGGERKRKKTEEKKKTGKVDSTRNRLFKRKGGVVPNQGSAQPCNRPKFATPFPAGTDWQAFFFFFFFCQHNFFFSLWRIPRLRFSFFFLIISLLTSREISAKWSLDSCWQSIACSGGGILLFFWFSSSRVKLLALITLCCGSC